MAPQAESSANFRVQPKLNIEKLITAVEKRWPVLRPSSAMQNMVSIIIDELSDTNCEEKATECMRILDLQYWPWLGHYIVLNRASVDFTYHNLYVRFFVKMKRDALLREVVNVTYECCKALLKSEHLMTSSQEARLLKNLGSWLGKITLGRNKQIRASEINIEELILEAYENGLMTRIIPFATNVMETCHKNNLLFQLPNPWTTAILSLFVEIYCQPNLKPELELIIQYMFDHKLHVDMKEIKGKPQLQGRKRKMEGNPDFLIPNETNSAVLQLFKEWAHLNNSQEELAFISELTESKYFKTNEMINRFFFILTEFIAAYSLAASPPILVNSYGKLVLLLVKFYGVAPAGINLLNQVLSATVRFIQEAVEDREVEFQPYPYDWLFIFWLSEFNTPIWQPLLQEVLVCFADTLTALQPLRVPEWSLVWLELIGHQMFMPKLLHSGPKMGWQHFLRLLVALFKFLEHNLRRADFSDSVRRLHKETLRVLFALGHKFPEFLCVYHLTLCDVIPPSCIEIRNLILSACPTKMELPNSSIPQLCLLPEMSRAPQILSDVEATLIAKQMKDEVDEYLKTRQSSSNFLLNLKQHLLLPPAEVPTSGTRYNVPLINSLVLYVGMTRPAFPITDTASMDIFQTLIGGLDNEGRYWFLNAIVNQLRYPNSHTRYFSCVLLDLFEKASQEIIQEQITRVLVERLTVNRPHPWGLLTTFFQLIKNPMYDLWQHGFTKYTPDIKNLLDSAIKQTTGPQVALDVNSLFDLTMERTWQGQTPMIGQSSV